MGFACFELAMNALEIIITVLLLCLLALGVYLATFWTISRRKKEKHEGGRGEVPYKYLEEEAENARRKVATAYAQETMPKITITPVQPRPNFPRSLLSSDELLSTEDEGEEEPHSDEHVDLGRLYFALRYDQHSSMLIVRLIRAEDIPMERESTGTYVDVNILPLNLQSHTFEPSDTTININFREVYEFPLSLVDLALQTLNLHIFRYDNFSRRTSVGDVFLALAELSAQGIDFTREVFLCRNIISHHEIYRTLDKGKHRHPTDKEQEDNEMVPESKLTEKKVGRKVSSQRMWDVLRRAVMSGSYKGDILASDSAMYWESVFTPDVSSAASSPLKSPGFTYFSDPGPLDEPLDESSEEEGTSWKGREEAAIDSPADESDFDSSANEQGDERRKDSSQSPPIRHVQLSPAPEEYYRIVPITPFTNPSKERRESAERSYSWKLPQTYTSRDHDVVQTLSQAYKEPRVVPFTAVSQFEPGPQPSKSVSFQFPPARDRSGLKDSSSRTSRQKKSGDTKKFAFRGTKKTGTSRRRRRLSPRKEPDGEPDGEPAEKMVSAVRGKSKLVVTKLRSKSSLKSDKMTYQREEIEPYEDLSFETAEDDSLLGDSSRLSEDVTEQLEFELDPPLSLRMNFPSISTEDYRTPPISTFSNFYAITRSQSDPNVDAERFRRLGGSSSEYRRVRSMLEVHDDRTTDDEEK